MPRKKLCGTGIRVSCSRCRFTWLHAENVVPARCPNCGSEKWQEPRIARTDSESIGLRMAFLTFALDKPKGRVPPNNDVVRDMLVTHVSSDFSTTNEGYFRSIEQWAGEAVKAYLSLEREYGKRITGRELTKRRIPRGTDALVNRLRNLATRRKRTIYW